VLRDAEMVETERKTVVVEGWRQDLLIRAS
jgi:hypothetical protein